MEEGRRPDWQTALRTSLFAVLVAGILLGLAFGLFVPRGQTSAGQRAERYRREADFFVRAYYLARAVGWEGSPVSRGLLETAQRYYSLSTRADPSDLKAAASLALVVGALGDRAAARNQFVIVSQHEMPLSRRQEIAATEAILWATHPRLKYVLMAEGFVREFVPGPMVLATAYERMERQDLADGEWRAAEAQGLSLRWPLAVLVAVRGGLVGAGAVGLLVIIVGLFRRRGRALMVSSKPAAPAAWGVREAVEALILWVFVGLAASRLLGAVLPAERGGGVVRELLPGLVAGAAAIAWVWIVSPSGSRLGWRLAEWRRQAAAGLCGAGLAVIPVLALYQVLQQLELQQQHVAGGLPEEHPLIPLFVTQQGWQMKAIVVVAACLIVPVVEEAVFRGILYRALRRHWSFAPAAAGSALVFAVGHLSPVAVAPYLLLGVVFAYLYERYESLVAPAVAHGAFNAYNLVLLLVVSG